MRELIEFRIGELRELRIGESAHQEVHLADAAMPGAESNAAAADLAVHLRRIVSHMNSFATSTPRRAVYIVAEVPVVTRFALSNRRQPYRQPVARLRNRPHLPVRRI